ncbi:hypothetical protein PP178_14570 [Zeaxanthinibacter sp. PT1]|uniref:hypothetical protein n=1 Tax=Zeaxanthinibacter TaxID=561554 RepID=UPI00234A7417|nr:hypothetical protein [Zeaxanthinibacter sp. PT1]MDC6352783.1 hypothetical protein [Zeaxanthinibacter sp. PT1]
MKSFISNCLIFSIVLLGSLSLLTIASNYIGHLLFPFELPKHTRTVILGNSHPECAINDDEIPTVVNLAQSGTAYYYDYLKLRELTARNPQIRNVILGYSYHDLEKNMDDWLVGESKLKYKLRNHFLLFNFQDYFELLQFNPWGVIKFTPQTIFYNINAVLKGYSYLGGYKHLERVKLEEAIKYNKGRPALSENSSKSEYQKIYLKRIYEYCERNNLNLILLHTPIHPIEAEYYSPVKDYYKIFAENELPEAILINHAELDFPEKFFADLDHLNYKGARRYTEIIDNSLRSLGVINPHL